MKKKFKVVNRTRFYIFVTMILLIAGIVTNTILSTAKAYSNPVDIPFEEVIVSEGDTLWFIAIDFMPKNYDVREMIYNIRQLNEMKTASIHPGDIIKIPIID